MKKTSNLNHAWAGLLVQELRRLGCDAFFAAPGSRSSPLVIAAAEHGGSLCMHFDERGLGFLALGHARGSGRPAVIITTSGTAVANLLPAVCEASNDGVPLIILSADRPPELRDCGANQAMDQVGIFGSHVRWQVDLPCPDLHVPPSSLLGTIDYAVFKSYEGFPGPVHLNQMFREPLAPVPANDGASRWLRQLDDWSKRTTPWTDWSAVPATLPVAALPSALGKARRGMVVAGEARDRNDSARMLALAERLGWPLLPDVRSGLRLGASHPLIMSMADQALLSSRVTRGLAPDLVLHLGGRITSKRIQQFIASSRAEVVQLSPFPVRMDPDHCVGSRVVGELPLPGRIRLASRTPASWARAWRKVDDAVGARWRSLSDEDGPLTEPGLAALVSSLMPDEHALFLSSSMPVRDMDMYGLVSARAAPRVVANRGVSGIDGTVATAAGFARGSGRPVTLVVGDLALLHDLNSLSLLRESPVPVIVVVINNDGGGIFSFLPVAEATPHFEACFGVPHGLSGFSDAAALFDLDYACPETTTSFRELYGSVIASHASAVLEVRTDRQANLRVHRRIQGRLRAAADHAV